MATLVATRLVVTNVVSSSGAVRVQVLTGTLPNQSLLVDMEMTAAQNAALSTALAAAAGTVTNFDMAAQESPLVGVYQVA
jgi:hypothetical protein